MLYLEVMIHYLFAELPESMYLEFKCGVQIQLGFAAEFSNVMIIYTRIVKKPPEIAVCRAYVTDFALVSASRWCPGGLWSAPSTCIFGERTGLRVCLYRRTHLLVFKMRIFKIGENP